MLGSKYNTTALFSLGLLVLYSIGCGTAQLADQAATNQTETVTGQQGAAESAQSKDDMKLMVTASLDHHAKQGKGPSDWDGFLTWAEANNPESVEALRRLRKAGVVFFRTGS